MIKGTKHTEQARIKIGLRCKGKTFEQIYGVERAKEIRYKFSLNRAGKPLKNTGTPWNKGVPLTDECKAKLSQSHKGQIAWNKGKKGMQIPWNKGKTLPTEYRKKLSEAHKGQVAWNKGKKLSPQHIHNILKKNCQHPNKFETKVAEYLGVIYPNRFKFVGDGSLVINGRSPDFIDLDSKVVVLANGYYWHLKAKGFEITDESKRIVEAIEKEPFLQAGYAVIFIWEDELKLARLL